MAEGGSSRVGSMGERWGVRGPQEQWEDRAIGSSEKGLWVHVGGLGALGLGMKASLSEGPPR